MKNNVLKNIAMVMSSNMLLMFLGIIMSFVLPMIISVESYGYWQMYLYYSGFVGFFMFGFNDGMNIRFAGSDFEKLDKNLFKSFFKIIIIMSIAFMTLSLLILSLLEIDVQTKLVFFFVSLNIAIFNIHGFCTHLNQMTLRFKYYSIANIIERIMFVSSFPLLILFNNNFIIVITINIICRFFAMTYNLITIRELFKNELNSDETNYNIQEEIKNNYKAGFPLMLATIFAMLMTTTPRIIVENLFSIEEYGVFSFGYSTLNLAIQIITAMSSVFYPSLKRIPKENYSTIYRKLKLFTIIISLSSLIMYYPANILIQLIYPKYHGVLGYLFLLFPIVIFQIFNSLITANFARLQRLEKKYLLNNGIFFGLNFVLSWIIGIQFNDIILILLISIIIMLFWTLSSDRYIMNTFFDKSEYDYSMFMLSIVILVFILVNNFLPLIIGFFVYSIVIIILIYINKNQIVSLFNSIRKDK